MKLILVRHGQSTANANPSVYYTTPDSKIPLTELGINQAMEVGNQLKGVDCMYVSPYERTRQTALAIMSITGELPASESVLLREQEWPRFKSAKEREIFLIRREKSGEEFFFKEQGSESLADVALRAETFLNKIRLTHKKDDVIVIVAHEVFIRMALMVLDNKNYENSWVQVKNCEVIEREL